MGRARVDCGARVARWERSTEWPLAIVAVAFLIAYAVPILWPGISTPLRRACSVCDLVAWVLFAIDYAWRVVLARHRSRYVASHWTDLLVVALPILRPLRLLRLVMLLRVFNRRATSSLRGRVATYVASATALLLVVAALAALNAERGKRGANIETFGDALWWAFTTVSTVGYGDRYPVTAQGRAIAVGLMVGGVALLGVVTATFAAWLVEQVRDAEAESTSRTEVALVDEVAALRREIADLRAAVDRPRIGT